MQSKWTHRGVLIVAGIALAAWVGLRSRADGDDLHSSPPGTSGLGDPLSSARGGAATLVERLLGNERRAAEKPGPVFLELRSKGQLRKTIWVTGPDVERALGSAFQEVEAIIGSQGEYEVIASVTYAWTP